MSKHRSLFLTLASALLAGSLSAFNAGEHGPGLYAVFQTSAGEFACELYFEDVPMTVANFVGLAEGTKGWRKLEAAADNTGDGQIFYERYYDGMIFHRIVGGFVIQSGSRNGLGTDGPGYQIPDEIIAAHKHVGAGVLSMANTGSPNSGGSQWFVTLAATPHLDGLHAVFGGVVEGLDIVQAIGLTDPATDPTTIQSVTIVREGSAAEAFSTDVPGLPTILPLDFFYDPVRKALTYPVPEEGVYQIWGSEDLEVWELGFQLSFPDVGSDRHVDLTGLFSSVDRFFFRGNLTRYSALIDQTGKRLSLEFDGMDPIVVDFTSNYETSYTQGATTGNSQYVWDPIGNIAQLRTYLPVAGKANHIFSQVYVYGGAGATSGAALVHIYRTDILGQADPIVAEGTYTLTPIPSE